MAKAQTNSGGRASSIVHAKLGSNLGRTSPLHDVHDRIVGGGTVRSEALSERAVSPDPPFDNVVDHSRVNMGRHQATRNDTFHTPTRLGLDKRSIPVDGRAMHDLFEQGFSRSVQNLGRGILEELRAELVQAMTFVRKDMIDRLTEVNEEREAAAAVTLTKVLEEIKEIRQEASKPHVVDVSDVKAELDKLREGIESGDMQHLEGQRNLEKILEDKMLRSVDLIFEEIKNARQHQEQGVSSEILQMREDFQKLQKDTANLATAVGRSEEKLGDMVLEQHSLSLGNKATVEEVRKIQVDSEKRHDELVPLLKNELIYKMKDDIEPVLCEVALMKNSKDDTVTRMETILGEIGKVQQAMHTDYLQTTNNLEQLGFPVQGGVRVREFFAQTDYSASVDQDVQTDKAMEHQTKKKDKEFAKLRPLLTQDKLGKNKPKNVIDGEAIKARMQEQIIKGEYNVCDLYYTDGCSQAIARSRIFETITFLVIFANAIWIGVDADLNSAAILVDAEPVFQIVENLFCAYFTCELLIRFLAFRFKRDAFGDFWFVFDFCLVFMMVVETWLLTFIVWAAGAKGGAPFGDLSMLRMVRMVKMFRMARMARVLRSVPELVVLVKTIGVAARSVFFFFLFWLIIIYIYAIACRQITKEDDYISGKYFDSVPAAMNTLLLDGILPANADFVNELAAGNAFMWPVIVSFLLLATLTVMNMLVGVLVEVVGVVAGSEKEKMSILDVKYQLQDAMEALDIDPGTTFPQYEFGKILMFPEMLQVMQNVDVDPVALADTADFIYEDMERELKAVGLKPGIDTEPPGLTFETFIDTVLKMRGKNKATVKDVKEQTRIMKGIVSRLEESFQKMVSKLHYDMQNVVRSMPSEAREFREYTKTRSVILSDIGSDARDDDGQVNQTDEDGQVNQSEVVQSTGTITFRRTAASLWK